MMKPVAPVLLGILLSLTGCSTNDGLADLEAFVEDVRNQPRRPIEPLPEFKAYTAFSYSAADRRSPFMPPVETRPASVEAKPQSNVKPDDDRPKEKLESFDLGAMVMVGTIQKEGENQLYALVRDSSGELHRVRQGHYMGKNHGRVVSVSEAGIQLVEIVPDGSGGWFERPRTITITEAAAR